jgi:HD-like signal output (HDOD) protein
MTGIMLLIGVLVAASIGVGVWLWRRAAALPASPSARATDAAASSRRDASTKPPTTAPGPTDDVFAQFYELAFGLPQRPPSTEPEHLAVAAAVRELLTEPPLKPEYAPRRPLLLPKLLQATNDAATSPRELASIIATDPALTGNLLRLANSPFYRLSAEPVENLDRAVAVLGTEGIRSVIAAALMQPLFRTVTGEFKRFPDVIWSQTLSGARGAEAYAALVAGTDPFAAQLLGLLLGLASILVFRAAMTRYAEARVTAEAATIAVLINAHAATVAREIARDWQLSDRILAALDDQQSAKGREPTPLGRALQFGRCVGALQVLRGEGVLDDDAALAHLRKAGFDDARCERIWSRISQMQD